MDDAVTPDWANCKHGTTNNFAESYNKSLNQRFSSKHNNVWSYVEILNKEMQIKYLEIQRLHKFVNTTRRRDPKTLSLLEKNLKRSYDNGELSNLNFLCQHLGISPCYSVMSKFDGYYEIILT